MVVFLAQFGRKPWKYPACLCSVPCFPFHWLSWSSNTWLRALALLSYIKWLSVLLACLRLCDWPSKTGSNVIYSCGLLWQTLTNLLNFWSRVNASMAPDSPGLTSACPQIQPTQLLAWIMETPEDEVNDLMPQNPLFICALVYLC